MSHERTYGLEGKRVVVTGASSGIGRAVSVELGRHGARLLLVGRNRGRLEETLALLQDTKGHEVAEVDLSILDDLYSKMRGILQRGGQVYGFCHAAGVVDTRPLQATTLQSTRRILEVNLLAGLELARVLSRRDVMEDSGGAMVFIASIYGLIGMPGETAYSASKGAVLAAVRTLAVELARRNIRVNAISPGFVKTAMTEQAFEQLPPQQAQAVMDAHPLGPGTPEDVARAAAFLLAPVNRWITGSNLVIDGGFTAR